MPLAPRASSRRRQLWLGLAIVGAAAAGGLLARQGIPASPRPPAAPSHAAAAAGLLSDLSGGSPANPASGEPRTNAGPSRPAGLDIAALSQYELISLPTRAEPIERWRAQRYFCAADFNRDDVIDQRDAEVFLETFANRAGPFAEFLDVNRDGEVDAADLEAFVQATQTPCDAEATAEMRAISC